MSKWSELYFPSKGHCTGAAENSVIYKNPLSGRVELMSLRRVHANAGQLRLSLKDDLIALSWKLRKTVFAITFVRFRRVRFAPRPSAGIHTVVGHGEPAGDTARSIENRPNRFTRTGVARRSAVVRRPSHGRPGRDPVGVLRPTAV